jgi:chemotaxis protein MotB
MQKFYQRKKNSSGEIQTYWISISDLMAGLLIIFVLFFVLKLNTEVKLRRVFEEMYKIKETAVIDLKKEFKYNNKIAVLDDGTVRFYLDDSDNQLFNVGSSKLKKGGKKEVRDFIIRYLGILFSEKYIEYVDKIVVQGHTDSKGTKHNTELQNYLYNLRLSQARAYSVVEYIHQRVNVSKDKKLNERYKNILRKKLSASGRSYIDVLKDKEGQELAGLSRRVEFKFHLPMEKKYLEFREQHR